MGIREQRVRERAYGFWKADGCRHGRDAAHWFRAEAEEPLRVTFDTNVLDKAARPERFPKDVKQPYYFEVHRALRANQIKGYFCETLITLEGIERKDRKKVLGSTRIESRSSSSQPNQITINVSAVQDREPVHAEMLRRVQSAIDVGMHALRAPPRIAFVRTDDPTGRLFEPDHGGIPLVEWIDDIVAIANAISARGIGFSAAQTLGLRLNEREAAGDELWLAGLGRARGPHEEGHVRRAVAEWADGDSVASHHAYGNDLFCTEDFNRSSDAASVLSQDNRDWLTESYGVRFITIEELAERVRSTARL